MNLPNKLTIARIILVPVLLIFIIPIPESIVHSNLLKFAESALVSMNDFIVKYGSYVAAALFLLASATDFIDGYIARKRNQVTKFGKFIDPIADKLLVTASLIALVQCGKVAAWAVIIIMARDFIVTGLRLIAAGDGVVISASIWGKIKTFTQMAAIVAVLLNDLPLAIFYDLKIDTVIMIIAVIATIYSGYDYIAKYRKVIAPNN